MKILVIGGAGFAGSEFVRAAVARGHDLTVFGRGNAKADLPDQVAMLVGDRFHDLNRLPSGRWDAVVDFAAFHPSGVELLAETLGSSVGHYTLVSTVMTYAPASGLLDERSRAFEPPDHIELAARRHPASWLVESRLRTLG